MQGALLESFALRVVAQLAVVGKSKQVKLGLSRLSRGSPRPPTAVEQAVLLRHLYCISNCRPGSDWKTTTLASSCRQSAVHFPSFCQVLGPKQGPLTVHTLRHVAKASRGSTGKSTGASEGDEDDDESPATGPTKTVKIYCAKCGDLIYKYRKGGNGALVKCFVERIAEDHTNGDMKCAGCGRDFARFRIIKGKPAHKIIGGKVIMRK